MHAKSRDKLVLTVVGWLAAGLIFFPIFWMVLTSFKTEVEAVRTPPSLFFQPHRSTVMLTVPTMWCQSAGPRA